MTADELERYIRDRIPLTRPMGIRVSILNEAGLTLSVPLQPNTNDKGTAFAGSISALLTLSGWALLHVLLAEDVAGLRIAVTESAVRYLKPAHTDFVAVCEQPGHEALQKLKATLARKGKARMSLTARLLEQETVCAEFQGTYVVRSGNGATESEPKTDAP